MIEVIENWLLGRLQKRCKHPSHMVAADLMEHCIDNLEVKYCNRCGAVKTLWTHPRFTSLEHPWRRPDPNLWRG